MPVSYYCTPPFKKSGHKVLVLLLEAAKKISDEAFSKSIVCKKQVLCYRVLIQSFLFTFTSAAEELPAVFSTISIKREVM